MRLAPVATCSLPGTCLSCCAARIRWTLARIGTRRSLRHLAVQATALVTCLCVCLSAGGQQPWHLPAAE